jgi:tetratricopeptide (TPR) repeat protein
MNFWRVSAREGAALSLAALLAGCGASDGVREYELARTAYGVRDLAKAEKLLMRSLSCRADNVDALVTLARVRLDLGQIPLAQETLAKAAALAGTDVDVRLLGAQLDYHAKNYDRAAAVFTALAADRALEPRLRSQAQAGLGVVEMTRNAYDRARIALLTAIRLNRRNPAAWYHLGYLYRDGFGYSDAALEQFEIYVRLEEKADRRAQDVQRTVIPELKEAIARSAAERPGASRRDSKAAADAIVQAEQAWKKGQYKTAKLRYQEAWAADPLSYPAALGLARAWEKTDASAAGKRQTFTYYRAACALRPGAISTYLTTGRLASELGSHAAAVEIFSRAMAADPANLDAVDGLIRALRRVNKTKAAAVYQAYRETLPVRGKRGK